jgi:hypothetical protein
VKTLHPDFRKLTYLVHCYNLEFFASLSRNDELVKRSITDVDG